MPLVKPSLAPVSAGQPVTAQAWNAVLSAIGALYDAVLAFGTASVDVTLTGPSGPVTDATVIAVPTTGAPVIAVPPRAGGTSFTLTNLRDGAWTVHVTAHGFSAAQAALTVPRDGALPINLAASTRAMPDLLGKTAAAAIDALEAAAIQLDAIFDVTGDDVNKTTLPANRAGSLVLFQFPLPGEQVLAATAKTRLVLSAEPEAAQITTVPNLKGATLTQLQTLLAQAGLKLGKITYAK
jgi:ribosomal protein S11